MIIREVLHSLSRQFLQPKYKLSYIDAINIYKFNVIHHYQIISSTITNNGVIQLYFFNPQIIQVKETNQLLIKSTNRRKSLYTLRLSLELEEDDTDVCFLLQDFSSKFTFDTVALFLDLLNGDINQNILLCQDINQSTQQEIFLYASYAEESVQFILLEQGQNLRKLKCSIPQFNIMIEQIKDSLPQALGWKVPNQFIKEYERQKQY